MLRKLLSMGAFVVVAAAFAATPASAKNPPGPPNNSPADGGARARDGQAAMGERGRGRDHAARSSSRTWVLDLTS